MSTWDTLPEKSWAVCPSGRLCLGAVTGCWGPELDLILLLTIFWLLHALPLSQLGRDEEVSPGSSLLPWRVSLYSTHDLAQPPEGF